MLIMNIPDMINLNTRRVERGTAGDLIKQREAGNGVLKAQRFIADPLLILLSGLQTFLKLINQGYCVQHLRYP